MAQGYAPLPTRAPDGVTLVLGGARSGKSRFAERLVAAHPRPVYLATAEPGDDEMRARIRAHRQRRDARWTTVEEPLALPEALTVAAGPGVCVLIDCLTLWLSNLMGAGRDVAAETARLVAALERPGAPVVCVSNEVGLGLVPDNPLARAFRDHAGRLHQAIAAVAGHVYFVVAGIPMTVKPTQGPLT